MRKMCFVSKFVFDFLFIASTFFADFSQGTIDINSAEFQYVADHLTEKECHTLVAALHFHSFEILKENDAAERRLPEKVSCIDLLLHWNSTPKEGRGKTHVEICHRLNQMGREDLAQWLSKTVFHEIGKDLKVEVVAQETENEVLSFPNVTQVVTEDVDEAAWTVTDSIVLILVVFGLITLFFGLLFLCILRCSRSLEETLKYYRRTTSK